MSSQNQTHIIGATTFYLPLLGATFGPYLFDSGPQCVKGMLQTTDGTTLSILPNIGGSGATLGSLGYLLSVVDEPFTWEGPAKFYIGSQSSYSTAQVTLFYNGNDKDADAAKGSTAFAFTPASLFQNNEPGVWYDPSEIDVNWRKNLFSNTQEFENVNWAKSGSGTATIPVVTPNYALGPDGVSQAARVEMSLGGGTTSSDIGQITQYITSNSSSMNYSVSFWIRSNTGSNQAVALVIQNSQSIIINVTPTWQRISFTRFTVGSTGPVGLCGIRIRGGSGTSSTLDVLLWGPQIEAASAPTSYQRITDGVQDYWNIKSLPTMFQNSTTPVSGLEQPVGLLLDKSKNLTLSAQLATGTFTNSPGYPFATFTSSDATGFVGTTTGASGPRTYIGNVSSYENKFVEIKGTISSSNVTSSSINFSALSTPSVGLTSGVTVTSNGDFRAYLSVPSTAVYILFAFSTSGASTTTVTNLSIREVAGNHAFQGTAASRPVLSARVNLLTYTQEFDNAIWLKSAAGTGAAPVVTANAGTDPLGGNTADRVQFSRTTGTSNDRSFLQQTVTGGAATTSYTLSLWVKSNTGTNQTLSIYGNFGTAGARVYLTATNSWQLFTCSGITTTAGNLPFIIGFFADTISGLTADVLIWGASLVPTNQASLPYQRVGNPTAGSSTTAGVQDYDATNFPIYLKFDGVDDVLTTNNIDFSSTSISTVVVGVRKLSDAAAGIIADLSANSGQANSFGVFAGTGVAGTGAGRQNYAAFYVDSSGASTNGGTVSPLFTSPTTDVLRYVFNKSFTVATDIISIHVDGSAKLTSAFDVSPLLAGSNFGNYPLFIGRRSGANFPFNGHIYALIIRGTLTSATQAILTENYVNQKTKAY